MIGAGATLLAAAALAGPSAAPARLSETGLFVPGTTIVAAENRPYAPQYPLWTDGAEKSRWIYLPPGATIDVTDADLWDLPAGTKLWKEFAYAGRRVETRLLWKATDTGWVAASYVWNEEQTDAVRAPADGVRNAYPFAPGKSHSIPASTDCVACHEGSRARVLGFTALQLSDDRDPLAPQGAPLRAGDWTIRSLLDEGRLSPARRDLVERPPRIPSSDPVERAALGYLAANCGHCHNAEGPLASLGLVLAHAPYGATEGNPGRETTWDEGSQFVAPGVDPSSSRRIVPGDPDGSALVYRMRSRRPSSQMPPLGTVVRDGEALALLERWIRTAH